MDERRTSEDSHRRESRAICDKLRRHVGTKKKICIETKCHSHERLNGYLLGLSDQLGLMHCFHDFMPDGYTVFRLEDVASIRSNKYERLWDKMLAAEGLLAGLQRELLLEMKDISSAIASISEQFSMMSIEVEVPDEDVEEFYIGEVVLLHESEVDFLAFDALGQWESECDVIMLDEIAFIQFDTPYIKTFSKYLNGSKPNRSD